MSTISEHDLKRKNFIENVSLYFDFLCKEFGYTGPVHDFNQQSNGSVISDQLTFDNKPIDRRIVFYNAYHPVDYGFELQFYRPSITTQHSEREIGHYVLKENQDIEQTYLKDVVVMLREKFLEIITGDAW